MTTKILTSAFILATCCHSIASETQQEALENLGRKRRGYAYNLPKEISTDPSSFFSKWKPWGYTLSRPYFIPVYGAEGQPPLYFPPQPLLRNPGSPPDNPVRRRRPFKGPQYLPPKTDQPGKDMKVGNRFQSDDDDEEFRPVWGAILPTRPRPGKGNTIELSIDNEIQPPKNAARPRPPASKTTTTTSATTTTVPPSTTSRPGPSNCVWAVVSCCSVTTNAVPESCFEQRGCPGPFWGASPCDSDFAKAAIEAALKYYGGT
ncbi:unnamed protein product [Callosobruchus maculatus]|uniref:Uncharacterized protein n=1 Tax=Callosobruchus maculatus TaxID=64391 RepID=A0A653DHU1_CALMS|nr:unnamed protein product [Callosobruchus maculatus]